MEFGLGGVVGIIKTKLLVKNGLKHLIPKGLAFGMTTGAFITAILSGFSRNQSAPGDVRTNLSYVLKSGVYGIVTTLMIVKITDKSLFQQSQIPVMPDESKGEVLSSGFHLFFHLILTYLRMPSTYIEVGRHFYYWVLRIRS